MEHPFFKLCILVLCYVSYIHCNALVKETVPNKQIRISKMERIRERLNNVIMHYVQLGKEIKSFTRVSEPEPAGLGLFWRKVRAGAGAVARIYVRLGRSRSSAKIWPARKPCQSTCGGPY